VREQRRGFNFAWALRTFDKDRKLEDMYVYDKQVFNMPDGVIDIWPTFDEVITLPTGSHFVELVLYIIPLDFDATQLKTDPAMEKRYRQAFAAKDITISD
jgi:hypothetical protein